MSDVYAPRARTPRVAPRPTSRTNAPARPTNANSQRRAQARERLLSGGGGASTGLAVAAARAREDQDDRDRLYDRFSRPDTSLMGQARSEVKAAVTQGPAMIVKAGIGTATGPIRAAVDLIKDGEFRGGDGVLGAAREYAPLPTMMGESLNNTMQRNIVPFVQHGPAGVIAEWQEASDENRTANAIFEDIGNAALVAGAASKIIGRAPRVAAVANPTERLIVQGSTKTTPRSLSAGASANAQNRAVMMTPAKETARSFRRAAARGEVADVAAVPVVPRGTGLAGYARRAGNDVVADRLHTVGTSLGKATRVLDAPDNLTVGLQLVGAGKLAGAAARGGMRAATRLAPRVNALVGSTDNVVNQMVDPDARARRDIADEIMNARDGERLAISRESADILRVADDENLSRPQQTALLNSIDHRFDDIANAVDQLPEAEGRKLIQERFADKPPQMRPDYEGIRAIIDYRNNPDANPQVTQAIADVSSMLGQMIGERTQRALDATERPLNPEQLGNEFLSHAVDKVRGRLERKRDAALTFRDQAHTRTVRADNISRAQAAVNATIPEINSRALIEQGRTAGEAQQALRQLGIEHRKSQVDLKNAVDDFMRAERSDGVNSPLVRQLEATLERLTDETVALEARVLAQQRQIQATAALSKATGEVETVDVDGNPVNDPQAVIQTEIDEIAQRPDPDLSNMTTVDAIETAARQVVDEIKAELHQKIDDLTHGERPLIPGPDDWVDRQGNRHDAEWAKQHPKAAMRPGEFDWYERLSTRDKQVLTRDKWLATDGRGASPDDFARVVNARNNSDLSVDGAIELYLDLVNDFRELRARGNEVRTRREKLKGFEIDPDTGDLRQRYSPPRGSVSDPVPQRVVEMVAERLNQSEAVVRAALDGNAKRDRTAAMRDALGKDVRDGYDGVWAAWHAMDPELRNMIEAEGRAIAEAGDPKALLDYVLDVARENGLDRFDTMAVYGNTDGAALFNWLVGSERAVPEVFVRAVTETPGPVQRRLVKRLEDSLKASKAALRTRYSEQRSLRRIVDSVRDEANDRVEDMAGRVDVAEIQMDASQARLEAHMQNRPRLDETAAVTPRHLDGWRRTRIVLDPVTKRRIPLTIRDPATGKRVKNVDAMTGDVVEYPSRFEKDRMRQGRADNVRDLANRNRQAQVRRAQSYNDRIGNLQTELGRSSQLRLVEDINTPAVRGYFGVVRAAGKPLGNVTPKLGDTPAQLTGLMDRVVNKLGGRESMFAVARMMDEWGPFRSVDERYNAFIDALSEEGIRILDDTDEFRDLRDSMMAERAIEAMNDVQRALDPANMNLPYRVRDAARRATQGFPQEIRNDLEARFARYESRRNKHLRSTFDDYLAVMPKRFREVARENIANVRTYLDIAEKAINDGDPYLAEIMHRLAEDAPTTMQRMLDDGIDPQHLVGGKPVPEATSVRTAARTGGIGPTVTRGSKQSKTGGRPETLADYMRLEAAEQVIQVNAETLDFLKNHPGLTKRADAIVGDFIDTYTRDNDGNAPRAGDITKALDEAGWAPLPKTEGPIHRGTQVVPKLALKAMQADSLTGRAWPWKALATGNRIFKYSVLAASPLWQIGNVIGNLFMSTLGLGKMSVLDMPRLYKQAIQQTGGLKAFWDRGGLANWAPDELASHGLSFGEHELIRRAWDEKGSLDPSRFKKIVNASYSLNEFMDNSFRSIMYADQLQKMANNPKLGEDGRPMVDPQMSEKAVKHTLRALGDFTNMTAFEKRYVREVFPFWAWMRHQTLMTMRMPVYSPMRTAYLLALTDMLEDDDMANEFYEMVGSQIPLGGGTYLNLGNISPFVTPWDLPLPTNLDALSNAISPAIKAPVQMVSGFDIGRLRNTSRPYDEREIGPYNSTPPVAPPLRGLAGLGEMAYVAAGALPQTKMVRDLALGTGTARYGSGQRRVGNGEYDDDTSVVDTILAGTRMPRTKNREEELYELTQQMLRQQGR